MNLISQINKTTADYEKDLCIHHKLEFFAREKPDSIALYHKNKHLTYKELNTDINILANHLLDIGIQPEDRIVVCLERSFQLITSIFGILKTGGTYVPIIPTYPAERKKFIINDATPKVIITSKDIAGTFCETSSKILLVEDLCHLHNSNIDNPVTSVKSNNLAYIIYTSGTTGNPKGVMIEHHSVMNRIGWMQKAYPISENDVLIQKTSISFDVSIWELFWWSFTGAKLLLLNQDEENNPAILVKQIAAYKINVIHFVPSMLNMFIAYLQSIQDKKALLHLKYIFCSGEALNVLSVNNMYEELQSAESDAVIVNLYGPTEATVDVTYYLCEKKCIGIVPIGKPIDNTQIYIINEKNEVLPQNEKGELIICGVNLARGYLNRDALNREKFVYIDISGELKRAYKTGDVAFFNSEGEIEFVGRNDHQIKLRGFRIELGEIENSILTYGNITDCSVLVHNQDQGNASLAAFYIPKYNTGISNDSIKKFLKKILPDYMVPAQLIQIDQMPLNSNGKLDKKVLCEMLNSRLEEIKPPTSLTSTEQIVYDIWCQLLETAHIDMESNFFDVGGNSLLVVQMAILINDKLGIQLDMLDLFQHSSISDLSAYLFDKMNAT